MSSVRVPVRYVNVQFERKSHCYSGAPFGTLTHAQQQRATVQTLAHSQRSDYTWYIIHQHNHYEEQSSSRTRFHPFKEEDSSSSTQRQARRSQAQNADERHRRRALQNQ